ncbi:MAG: response regulator [Bryobacteraceae bacterium]
MTTPQPAILVVDDNLQVRRYVVQLLTEASFRCMEAEDATAALAAVASTPIALLVSDVRLQGASGVELARQARSLQPSLPVLLMSGYDLEGLDYEHIVKPFEPAEFLDKVRGMVSP